MYPFSKLIILDISRAIIPIGSSVLRNHLKWPASARDDFNLHEESSLHQLFSYLPTYSPTHTYPNHLTCLVSAPLYSRFTRANCVVSSQQKPLRYSAHTDRIRNCAIKLGWKFPEKSLDDKEEETAHIRGLLALHWDFNSLQIFIEYRDNPFWSWSRFERLEKVVWSRLKNFFWWYWMLNF